MDAYRVREGSDESGSSSDRPLGANSKFSLDFRDFDYGGSSSTYDPPSLPMTVGSYDSRDAFGLAAGAPVSPWATTAAYEDTYDATFDAMLDASRMDTRMGGPMGMPATSTPIAHNAFGLTAPSRTFGLKTESATDLPSLAGIKLSDVSASGSSMPPPSLPAPAAPAPLGDDEVLPPWETSGSLPFAASRPEDPAQLLVLGLPHRGARSRVETQFQIELQLVRPKPGVGFQPSSSYISPDGSLAPATTSQVDPVSDFAHLRLPTFAALKRLSKRDFRQPTEPSATLYADVHAVKASAPDERVLACTACIERERKRGQRRKDSRRRPHQDVDETAAADPYEGPDERVEGRKAIVTNCGQYLDIDNGAVVLPARLTCYCRHHSERHGFCIAFVLRDHQGNIFARGLSPPVLTTDDHKIIRRGTTVGGTGSRSGRSSLTTSANNSNEDVNDDHGHLFRTRSARGLGALSSSVSLPGSLNGDSATNSAGSSPDDSSAQQDPTPPPPPVASTSTRPKRDREADKPYGAHNRRKSAGLMRSPSFGMTPLGKMALSKPPSPTSSITPLPVAPSVQAPHAAATEPVSPSQLYASLLAQSESASQPSTPSIQSSFDSSSYMANGGQSSSTSAEPSPLGASSGLPMFGMDPASSLAMNTLNNSAAPRIARLIPAEGPVAGGVEVTLLGDGFTPNLVVTFGGVPAMQTQFWSPSTLVCVLPPSSSPGPVVVGFRSIPFDAERSLQLFTYVDDTDRSLMELALQVVGLRMTGRIEDAKQVAQRLVGGSGNFAGIAPSATVSGSTTPGASQRPMAMGFEGTLISFLELLDTDDDADVSSILDTTTPAKQTLLHLAAILGHHRLVSLLLALGADPDVQDRSGYTPLHCAALHGRVAVARLLLGADAAVFVRATDGRTAYELAVDHDQVDIVALFPSRALLLHRRSSSGVSLAFTGADLDSVVSLPSSGSSESDEGSDVERRLSRNVSSRSLSRMGESGGEHAAEKATIVRPAPSAIAAAYSTWLGRLVGAKEMRGTVPMYPPSASTTSSPTKQSARLVARAKLSRQLSPAATDVTDAVVSAVASDRRLYTIWLPAMACAVLYFALFITLPRSTLVSLLTRVVPARFASALLLAVQ